MATIAISPAEIKTVPTLAGGADTIQAIVTDPNTPAALTLTAPVATIDEAIGNLSAANTPGTTVLPAPANVHFFDGTVSVPGDVTGDVFKGTTLGVTGQFLDLTPDNLGITLLKPNFLIASGSGSDTLIANGGRNILAGGSGTDIYVGGVQQTTVTPATATAPEVDKVLASKDTFLADLSAGKTDATIFNFHSGDDAALIGVDAKNFALSFTDTAAGLVLTASPTAPGHNGATLTLPGYATTDIGGKLSFGIDAVGGGTYAFVHAN